MDDEDGIEVLNNALLRGEGSSRTARANRQTPAPKQSRTQATHLPQEMPPPFGQQNPQQGPQLDANTLMQLDANSCSNAVSNLHRPQQPKRFLSWSSASMKPT